jgi:hypothetical protein
MPEVQHSGRVRKDHEGSVRKLQQGPSLGSVDILITRQEKTPSSTYIYTEIASYLAQTNRSVRTDARLLVVCGLGEMPQELAIDHSIRELWNYRQDSSHRLLANDRRYV